MPPEKPKINVKLVKVQISDKDWWKFRETAARVRLPAQEIVGRLVRRWLEHQEQKQKQKDNGL